MPMPSFDERLKAFVMTELCGVLLAHAQQREAAEYAAEQERLELEAAVAEYEMELARSSYGEWA